MKGSPVRIRASAWLCRAKSGVLRSGDRPDGQRIGQRSSVSRRRQSRLGAPYSLASKRSYVRTEGPGPAILEREICRGVHRVPIRRTGRPRRASLSTTARRSGLGSVSRIRGIARPFRSVMGGPLSLTTRNG
jgi:hypothetical protein